MYRKLSTISIICTHKTFKIQYEYLYFASTRLFHLITYKHESVSGKVQIQSIKSILSNIVGNDVKEHLWSASCDKFFSMSAFSMHSHKEVERILTHSTLNAHCAQQCIVVPVICVRNPCYIFARFTLSSKSKRNKLAKAYFSHFFCYNSLFIIMPNSSSSSIIGTKCNDNAIRDTYACTCYVIILHSLAFNAIYKYHVNYDNSLLCEYVYYI